MNKVLTILLPFLFLLFVWKLIIFLGNYQSFLLPSPEEVFLRFLQMAASGLLFYHLKITLLEILLGFLWGSLTAFFIGFLLTKSLLLKTFLTPYLVAFQAIPIIALAPLIILWFGSGVMAKILICGLTVFFPSLVSALLGFTRIKKEHRQLFACFGAKVWQRFLHLELPTALPSLFSGLKIAATLSVIGAVVGEFVGSDRGLGFLINLASGLYDTPMRFVAFFVLGIIACLFYWIVSFLERKVIYWQL